MHRARVGRRQAVGDAVGERVREAGHEVEWRVGGEEVLLLLRPHVVDLRQQENGLSAMICQKQRHVAWNTHADGVQQLCGPNATAGDARMLQTAYHPKAVP
jgi:hypothetical protein